MVVHDIALESNLDKARSTLTVTTSLATLPVGVQYPCCSRYPSRILAIPDRHPVHSRKRRRISCSALGDP